MLRPPVVFPCRPRRLRLVSAIAGASICLASVACDDPIEPPGPGPEPPPGVATCAGADSTLSGTLAGRVLTADGGPYLLTGEVRVESDTLRIEAGALVCADASAALIVAGGSVVARGSPDRPVRLVWAEGGEAGSGIRAERSPGGVIELRHTLVEGPDRGITAWGWAPLPDLQDVTVRRTSREGVIAGGGRLERLVLDSVCLTCEPGQYALTVPDGRFQDEPVVVRDVTIQSSGGGGLTIYEDGPAILAGLRFDRIEHVAMVLDFWDESSARASTLEGPFVFGEVGEPAVTAGAYVARQLSTVDVHSEGSAAPLFDLTGGLEPGTTLTRAFRWRAGGGLWRSIRLAAGVEVSVPSGAELRVEGLTSLGTAQDPTVVSGDGTLTLGGSDHDLRGAVFSDSLLVRVEGDGARIVGARWRAGASLAVLGDSVALSGIRIDDARHDGVVAAGDALWLHGCAVSGSGGDGLRVTGRGAHVHHCSFVDNAGAGVAAPDGGRFVDGRLNWWGDEAGPLGPDGDGIRGAVDAHLPLSGPPPVSAEAPPTGAPVRLEAPDSIRIQLGTRSVLPALARDAAGRPLPATSLRVALVDTTVVWSDPSSPRSLVGARPGETTLHLRAEEHPALAAEVHVRVVAPPGVEAIGWTAFELEGDVEPEALWASSPHDVWVVGTGREAEPTPGMTARWNGTSWRQTVATNLVAVFGVGGSLFSGNTGALSHWTGTPPSWVTLVSRPTSDIWAEGPGALFVGGAVGAWRYDAVDRSVRVLVRNRSCPSVSGRTADEVYFACDDGIYLWGGVGAATRIAEERVTGLWAGPSIVWAVGPQGRVGAWEGGAWRAVPAPASENLRDVHGTSDTDVWVVGAYASLLHFDGEAWRRLAVPRGTGDFRAVRVVDDAIYVADSDGRVLVGIRRPAS